MRQPVLNPNANPRRQQGFTLFIVLIMMLVIAIVVIASMQSTNTEMRISSNEADRKYAFSTAEQALRSGENRIVAEGNDKFKDNETGCTNGICGGKASATTPVWKRTDSVDLDKDGKGRRCLNGTANKSNACYMVERIGPITSDASGLNKAIYRVTARSWGQNGNTVVTLQSHVEYSVAAAASSP